MRVALLGTGLIGGSIGLALKAADPATEIIAFDLDRAAAQRAVDRGAADSLSESPEGAVGGADLVFVATPVGAIPNVIESAASALSPGAILTDVGSTKSRVVVEVERRLPAGVHFIGGHPMAGSEDEGIDAASSDLFRDAWWILTPTGSSAADAYRKLHGVLTTLGARVMALDPQEHDELMAVISHVPQLTATALMNMAVDRGREHGGLLALAAGGFRDVTRVAASNPEIWLDICRENGEAIAAALEQFASRLLGLRDLLKQNNPKALRSAFESARSARRELGRKPAAIGARTFEIRFPVPDRPGVLADVTTSVGNLGINIEDLQITHAAEGGRGTLHLTVGGAREAEQVAETLRMRGYQAKAIEL